MYDIFMARKLFSSDFHFGAADLMLLEKWPFKTIQQHDAALIRSCMQRAKPEDIIYHMGDMAQYRQDSHYGSDGKGLEVKPYELIKNIPATFINIRGNHDLNNKVKSVCDSMHMFLSKRFPSVSLSHYPTYDRRIDPSCLTAPIHICGHVHSSWRHCLDLDHKILNVNVGCMVWGFKIITEDELTAYLNKLFKRKPQDLFHCYTEDGKLKFIGDKSL